MMKIVKCPVCQERKRVVGYRRDDPVLVCGHVLDVESQLMLETVDMLERFCYEMVCEKVDVMGVDVGVAERLVVEEIFG
jgi:hypothetical protein